jgi:hypothetical protein
LFFEYIEEKQLHFNIYMLDPIGRFVLYFEKSESFFVINVVFFFFCNFNVLVRSDLTTLFCFFFFVPASLLEAFRYWAV